MYHKAHYEVCFAQMMHLDTSHIAFALRNITVALSFQKGRLCAVVSASHVLTMDACQE